MKPKIWLLVIPFSLDIFLHLQMAIAFAQTTPQVGTVESHAHLFMKEGMSWMFDGGFSGELRAKSWKDRFKSQANEDVVEKSGNAIIVVTLYAHPLLVWSLRDSIRRQIKLTNEFVANHPDWVLAKTAQGALEALTLGKKILILALEGISGIIENDDDIKEFIDKEGIRIVTPLHLTDDIVGGVAFLRGANALSSPWAWLSQIFSRKTEDGVILNKNGLTTFGTRIIGKLMDHHVWIDLSHASDTSQGELKKLLKDRKLPLLYTHTVLRKYHQAERGITEQQVRDVRESQGVIGLMPSEDMLEGTFPRGDDCTNGFKAFVKQYRELVEIMGVSESIVLGSDTNGGVRHLGPGCQHHRASNSTDQQGYWNLGQTHEVWDAVQKDSNVVPVPRRKMVDYFIAAWSRI